MQNGSIAKRYSKALIDLAVEAGSVDKVLNELLDIKARIDGAPSLKTVMVNPSFRTEQRIAVLRELVQGLNYSDLTRRFLFLMASKNRMVAIDDVIREFHNYSDNLRGVVRVSVTTAVPLTQEQDQQLVTQIEQMTGKKAVVTHTVDPNIIGGVVTRINDLLIDGSVATQLSRMRSALLKEKTV